MDREIVFVLKELEIWSIIPQTIHICKKFHNFQGTFTFLISTELHNTLKRGKRYHFHLVSVHFSHSVMSDSQRCHRLHHIRLPCPSPTTGAYSNSCPSSRWCHSTISSFVVPFSSHLQSSPASGSFQMSQFLSSGGQSIGVSVSASVLPMDTKD